MSTLTAEQQLLHDVVATRSFTKDEAAVGALLVERMKALGFDRAWIDGAGNACGAVGAEEAPQRLVFLGHMDTVPGWIDVRVEDGILHGRGSVDAKGPLAAYVCALARCQDAVRASGVQVGFVACVEEESTSSKGARHAQNEWAPEACIIGEPSGADAVTLGYKGRILCHYHRRAPTVHGAAKEAAAMDHGFAFHRAVIERQAEFAESGYHALQVTVRKVNSRSDGLYDELDMTLDIRVPPAASARELADWLMGLDPEATIDCESLEEPFEGPRRSPLVRAFTTAIRAGGAKPRFKRKTGTADMNIVGPVWGCPMLAYGPGDSSLDHTPEEHIHLAEFDEAVDVLERVILRMIERPVEG